MSDEQSDQNEHGAGCAGAGPHGELGHGERHVGRWRRPELQRAVRAGLSKGLVAVAVALAARQRQAAVGACRLRSMPGSQGSGARADPC